MKIAFFFIFGIALSQNPQKAIYLNFAETFENFPLIDSGGSINCKSFKSSTQLDFPSSFSYQLKEKSRAFIYTLEDGTECLGMTILDGDQNCGTGDFDRGEIVFKSEHLANHTTGNSFYKLRFYIPHNFKIDNYSGDHNIFQIKTDESPGGSILPLPQFLIQFRHEKSTYSFAKLLFNYGLEFDLGDCLGSLLDENGKVDLQNTYYRCCYECSGRQRVEAKADYGWNEILLQIQWSEYDYGWMDIWLNGRLLNSPGSPHTFVGNNVYNAKMFPFPGGSYKKYSNYMKFGHYRWGALETSTLFFDYFYADKDTLNIADHFRTNIVNDKQGVIDMREDIFFKNIRDADEYILLMKREENSFYIGNESNQLTIERLLSNNPNLLFYKDYQTAVRVRYRKGFNGKYSSAKAIRFNPDTKLKDVFCDNYDIKHNDYLQIERIKGASSYVLFFQELNNPTNQFYHNISAEGKVYVQDLFNAHSNLSTYKEYSVNVRARFQEYGKEGNYSTPCTVMFKPNIQTLEKNRNIFYPNPVFNNIIFTQNIRGKIEIYDIKGVLVENFENVLDQKINVEDLKDGLYFLLIESNNDRLFYEFLKISENK